MLDVRGSTKGQKAGRDQAVTSGETVFIRTHSEGKPLSCGNGENLQGKKLTGTLYRGLGVRRVISCGG